MMAILSANLTTGKRLRKSAGLASTAAGGGDQAKMLSGVLCHGPVDPVAAFFALNGGITLVLAALVAKER